MTRKENADSIATGARVFARKSAREGTPSLITDDLIHGVAETLGIAGTTYSMRSVWTLIRRECAASGELGLISPERRAR